jgi:hypothetical protein
MVEAITTISSAIHQRLRFWGSRESGVVSSIVLMNPKTANLFRPIIIHDTGATKLSAG